MSALSIHLQGSPQWFSFSNIAIAVAISYCDDPCKSSNIGSLTEDFWKPLAVLGWEKSSVCALVGKERKEIARTNPLLLVRREQLWAECHLKELFPITLHQGPSVKGPMVNLFSFAWRKVSVVILNSATVVCKQPQQYASARAWLCSSATWFTKSGKWPNFTHRPCFVTSALLWSALNFPASDFCPPTNWTIGLRELQGTRAQSWWYCKLLNKLCGSLPYLGILWFYKLVNSHNCLSQVGSGFLSCANPNHLLTQQDDSCIKFINEHFLVDALAVHFVFYI